ncbi:MAG TPA: hypothetical protein VM219_09860 [Phycisphaerae bacterium]|nr:hypothetical protein [Phycisphaerae bacterium]
MNVAFIWALLAVGGLLVGGILFWIAAMVARAENASFGRAIAVLCGAVGMAVVLGVFLMPALALLGDVLGECGIL